MIFTKKELRFCIMADRMMNRGEFKRSFRQRVKELFFTDNIMKFLRFMRKTDYYATTGNKLCYYYCYWKFRKLSIKMGFSIPYDVLGYGVTIPHQGTIVIGRPSKIGKYAVLQTSTCIAGNGKTIGDALYLATGAKITSCKKLGNNVSIAANSVVTKPYLENNILLAGVPATVKYKSPEWYIRDGELYKNRVMKCEKLKEALGIKN